MAKFLIEQHQETRSHRIATRQLKASGRRRKRRVDTPSPQPCAQILSWPELWHSDASLDRATEDDALLKGNVPSAHDWKDAWSLLSERCSLRAGARIFEKKHSKAKADSCSHLTPFSRECASLWRKLYGVRFGHHNADTILTR